MWDTAEGFRELQGKERKLFASAVVDLFWRLTVESEDAGQEWLTEVEVFDQVPIEDRPYLLLVVAESLLGSGPSPSIHAWNEGVVLAVFRYVEAMIEVEIDLYRGNRREEGRHIWRKLVYDAWLERCGAHARDIRWGRGEGPNQSLDSTNFGEWEFKVEGLTDQILEDRDCEVDAFMDIPPKVASEGKEELGIPDDYYTAAPPSLPPVEKERLRKVYESFWPEADPALVPRGRK